MLRVHHVFFCVGFRAWHTGRHPTNMCLEIAMPIVLTLICKLRAAAANPDKSLFTNASTTRRCSCTTKGMCLAKLPCRSNMKPPKALRIPPSRNNDLSTLYPMNHSTTKAEDAPMSSIYASPQGVSGNRGMELTLPNDYMAKSDWRSQKR